MAAVRQVSMALAVLAAITFGVALADIIYTKVTVCDGDSAPACSPMSVAIILTYVASGLWASVFVFIAALWGLCFVGNPYGERDRFLTLLFLAAVIFIPAMTIISGVMIYMVLTETPGQSDDAALFDFGMPDEGYVVKFILPLVVALLGLVMFFMAAGMLVYVYSISVKEEDEEDIGLPMEPPVPRPIISPGFGYYYPSRIYELRAGTPGYSSAQVVPYGNGGSNGRYYY